MFGQIRPIVVDENNVILAGNGLYETLLRMNKEDALVYKYEDLTEAQKKKLMIADNKIFEVENGTSFSKRLKTGPHIVAERTRNRSQDYEHTVDEC